MSKKQKLRISFLLRGRGNAGSTRSTMRAGNELLARGHDVRIFYRNDTSGMRNRIRNNWLKLRYGFGNDWLLKFKGSSFPYNKLNATDFSPNELIVSMCARTTFDMYKLPEDIGIKVFYCRGAELENQEQILQTWRLPFAKIVTAAHLAEMIERETNQPVVGIAPNGVNTKEYFPVTPESSRKGVSAIFGWRTCKDPAFTIKVMQMLAQRLSGVPRYLFSNGKKPNGIEGIIFKRLPTVEQARTIFYNCKVWFLSSIEEGFGNPVLEAMACGCAVVSTDCGGPGDIIEDGVNGFLVEVGNTETMADKIELLYNDEQLRNHICTNARKTVESYSWPRVVDKLEGYLISIYDNEHR